MEPRVHPSTTAVTAGRPPRIPDNPVNTPIVPASTFHAEGPTEYAREGNPTAAAFEEALGALEHGHATVFSSGMAAANAILDLIPIGSTVIAPTNTYTGVAVRLKELAERSAINLILIPAPDTQAILAALPQADFLWLESPTNPMLDEADIQKCLAAAQTHKVISVVDNTFATPVTQRPLTMGADKVLHSVTKILSGHSDLLMGAVIASDPQRSEQIRELAGFVTQAGKPSQLLRWWEMRISCAKLRISGPMPRAWAEWNPYWSVGVGGHWKAKLSPRTSSGCPSELNTPTTCGLIWIRL